MGDVLYSRRRVLGRLMAAGMLISLSRSLTAAPARVSFKDVADRNVHIDRPVRRVLLGDGTLAYVLAVLLPDRPFADVVGWGENFKAADLDGYRAYLRKFPEMGRIPSFPAATLDSIGSELAISLAPDVVIMNLSSKAAAESSGLMARLTQVGIPIVFVDFRTRMFDNTLRSLQILGALLVRELQA